MFCLDRRAPGGPLAALAAVVAAVALIAVRDVTAAPQRSLCGVERWAIKTLKDRPHLLPVRTTTIRYLVSRPAPRGLGSKRLPFERHVFRITAWVTLFRAEDDGDIHLVLRERHGLHMIGESPSTSCLAGATPRQRAEMATARHAVSRCEHPEGSPPARATIVDVASFDYKHGQTGVAPNAIELHPILRFRCLRG